MWEISRTASSMDDEVDTAPELTYGAPYTMLNTLLVPLLAYVIGIKVARQNFRTLSIKVEF